MTMTPDSGGPPASLPPASLIDAMRRLLAPVVQLLLGFGVTFPMLTEYLKSIYVEVAGKHFSLPDRPTTQSRISLLTGVHRKDVRRLMESSVEPSAPSSSTTVGTQLVARWLADKRYANPDGSPKRLPLRARGGIASFEQLVEAVSGKDLRGRVVLDELVRLGVVVLEEDFVSLSVEGFIPVAGFDERAFYFGADLRDHIRAGAHNLRGNTPRFLDRSVSYHGLTERDVSVLREIAEREGSLLLRKLNRRALSMKRRNAAAAARAPAPDAKRMKFGLFFFSEDDRGSDD